MNHLGKLFFKPLYWHVLLPGHRLPVTTEMSMAGKRIPASAGLPDQTQREEISL
jgi:sulfide:quinone oxidoreductase